MHRRTETGTSSAGHIAVVGAGFIGQSWAIVFARSGYDVALYDADRSQSAKAGVFLDQALSQLNEAGLLNGLAPQAVRERIVPADTLSHALDGAFYVQENAPEKLDLKRQIFAELDALAKPGVILASSTSALLPTSFTEGLKGAARCIVAHPINPPHLVPAVEVVPGRSTSQETIERTAALMDGVGQSTVIMRREIDGFIINRLQGALLHEAFHLFAEGYADTESIDICVRDGLGLRWSFMGPFETIDLNAPGGISDYIERYGPFYRQLWQGNDHLPDWRACGARLESERSQILARSDMQARQVWRDSELMKIASARRRPEQDC